MKTRRRRDTLTSLRTGRPLPPISTMSAQQLHEELVEDAIAGVSGGERHLKRQVDAYMRIGKLTRKGSEQAFVDVRAEVLARTGLDMLMISARL